MSERLNNDNINNDNINYDNINNDNINDENIDNNNIFFNKIDILYENLIKYKNKSNDLESHCKLLKKQYNNLKKYDKIIIYIKKKINKKYIKNKIISKKINILKYKINIKNIKNIWLISLLENKINYCTKKINIIKYLIFKFSIYYKIFISKFYFLQ